jgi:ribosomal protein L4
MLSKESKIRVLENFYGIDYVLFGKPLKTVQNCCPIIKEEYVSIKGALLSVYIEMLKLMGHSPNPIEEKVNTKTLKKMAVEAAKNARLASKKLVTTEQARIDIKNELKEMLQTSPKTNISKVVENKIREKAFRLAVDNLLVARSLVEASDVKSMNDWTGKIIEDSYKILRDNLCETAMMIIDDDQPSE